jgi:hypothetical protein
MAFQAPDGGYVTQILNSLNQDSTVDLAFKGRSLHLAPQARSITTSLVKREAACSTEQAA